MAPKTLGGRWRCVDESPELPILVGHEPAEHEVAGGGPAARGREGPECPIVWPLDHEAAERPGAPLGGPRMRATSGALVRAARAMSGACECLPMRIAVECCTMRSDAAYLIRFWRAPKWWYGSVASTKPSARGTRRTGAGP